MVVTDCKEAVRRYGPDVDATRTLLERADYTQELLAPDGRGEIVPTSNQRV